MTTSTETQARCDINKVQVGSFWTRHDNGQVIDINGVEVRVRNALGEEWSISRTLLANQFSFADQHDQVLEVTRTVLIQIIKDNRGTAMTVSYHKKPEHTVIAKKISGGQGDMTARQWSVHIRDLIRGEQRTLVGFHNGSFDDFERLRFTAREGHRLIDTRTVYEVTVNRTTYKVR